MEPMTDVRVCFLHLGERKWFIARDPLHALETPDRIDLGDNAGTGPGMSFARTILGKADDAAIGLIPAAEGSKAKRFALSREINKILLRLPDKRKHTACVDARDTKGQIGDELHYHTEAQIEIGQRFAKAYLEVRAK